MAELVPDQVPITVGKSGDADGGAIRELLGVETLDFDLQKGMLDDEVNQTAADCRLDPVRVGLRDEVFADEGRVSEQCADTVDDPATLASALSMNVGRV